MKQHMRGSLKTEGIGLVVRNAHAKGYGLARENLKSSVECRTNMRRASTPNRDATKPVRFSNGTNHVGADQFIGPIAHQPEDFGIEESSSGR